jgi:predicted transposase/invertase (TIGR01784 family)
MISFDWAIKRLLRNKANFEVLEGFLSELLRRKIIVKSILESESNQTKEEDKYNSVDILVEADSTELVIIELQFYGQAGYFHRMLYGTSKTISEHIARGAPYDKVRKVYSINIVYFDLGTGEDYVYHGVTNFTGLHTHDELQLNEHQRKLYNKRYVGDLYPEYYILKIENFDNVAKDTLDEWIYYLKNNKIRDEFTAQGLNVARALLAYDNFSDEEKRDYHYNIKATRNRDDEFFTAYYNGIFAGRDQGLTVGRAEGFDEGFDEGFAKGKAKENKNIVINSHLKGIPVETIAAITNLSVEKVMEILSEQSTDI